MRFEGSPLQLFAAPQKKMTRFADANGATSL